MCLRAAVLAPDLLVPELGNVLWKKVRGGELTAREAEEIAEAFTSACPVTFRPSHVFLRAALHIATRFQRPVYDALYLALAVAENCPVITADDRLRHALQGTALERFVLALDRRGPERSAR
jgi:predicted nucleic acid-binding protein